MLILPDWPGVRSRIELRSQLSGEPGVSRPRGTGALLSLPPARAAQHPRLVQRGALAQGGRGGPHARGLPQHARTGIPAAAAGLLILLISYIPVFNLPLSYLNHHLFERREISFVIKRILHDLVNFSGGPLEEAA